MTRSRFATLAGAILVAILVWTAGGRAEATLLAAYVQGQGVLASGSGESEARVTPLPGTPAALGWEAGGRLLILDGYINRDSFGSGQSVSRGIVGLAGDTSLQRWRLSLRAGVGLISDEGGVLAPSLGPGLVRNGVVARAGLGLDRSIAPFVRLGVGLDAEQYSLSATASATSPDRTVGRDIFASLRLRFEVGI